MSALHLLWIIPLSGAIGFWAAAMMHTASMADDWADGYWAGMQQKGKNEVAKE